MPFFFFINVDHTLNAGFRALDISDFKPTTVFHLNVFDWLKSYLSGHDYVALGIYDSKLHTAFYRINKELSKGPFLLDFFFLLALKCSITNKCRERKFVLGGINRPVNSVHYGINYTHFLQNLLQLNNDNE